MYSSVSLVSTSLSAKKTRVSGVDPANKVYSAYIKHQRNLYAQCALYPVNNSGGSFEVWLQRDIRMFLDWLVFNLFTWVVPIPRTCLKSFKILILSHLIPC